MLRSGPGWGWGGRTWPSAEYHQPRVQAGRRRVGAVRLRWGRWVAVRWNGAFHPVTSAPLPSQPRPPAVCSDGGAARGGPGGSRSYVHAGACVCVHPFFSAEHAVCALHPTPPDPAQVDIYSAWNKVWQCGGAGQCGTCIVEVRSERLGRAVPVQPLSLPPHTGLFVSRVQGRKGLVGPQLLEDLAPAPVTPAVACVHVCSRMCVCVGGGHPIRSHTSWYPGQCPLSQPPANPWPS